jgi:hypothetical protein
MYNITDGGKTSSGFTNEYNDCTVRAISIAYQIPYAQAHAKLKDWGRKDGKPCMGFAWFMNDRMASTEKGVRPLRHRSLGTLQNFCKNHPTGRYVIRIKGHALAIVDGVINDSWKPAPRKQILEWWKVD